MKNYHKLVADILVSGESVKDRTGVGTKRLFGQQLKWDLRKGFPAITTKKLAWKAVVGELIWFLSGSTNVEDLRFITHGQASIKKTIWDDNYNNQAKNLGYTHGDLGPVYGAQWRNFRGVDQIEELVKSLREDPFSRRHIVSAWNVPELELMALPPCHYGFQCFVSKKNELSLMWNQRSVDVFLGLPFNIASYGLLTHILAEILGYKVGNLIANLGDTHIYENHMQACGELLSRDPYDLPTLSLPQINSIDEVLHLTPNQFKLINYKSHEKITAPMAV